MRRSAVLTLFRPSLRSAALVLWLLGAGSIAAAPDEVRLNGVTIQSPLTAIILEPGQGLEIGYRSRNLDDRLSAVSEHGTLVAFGAENWLFQPPQDRWRSLVTLKTPHRTVRVKVFLSAPLAPGARSMAGYLLGPYPPGTDHPTGMLKVEESQADELVSPNLRLGDLTSRVPATWPRYLLFSTALLEQLELVPAVLTEAGFPAAQISVLSAYRTPRHNRTVGGAPRSRHIYGDAADVIVDSDDDGRMDDLNGDGTISRADVEWLIARLHRAGVPVAIGGVGSYESSGPAGAFLHIDARGNAADWMR